MNDFDYDCYQKKVTGRSAVHRKNGSKSKRCSLPSDRLTEAQRKKMNGEVVTYQMKRPVSWTEFKEMPQDIRNNYLNGLIEEYGVTATQISEMFGMNKRTFYSSIKKQCPSISFKKGSKMPKDKRSAWESFVGFKPAGSLISPIVSNEEQDDPTTAEKNMMNPNDESTKSEDEIAVFQGNTSENSTNCSNSMNNKPYIKSFSMKFCNVIDLDQVINSLRVILGGNSANGNIEIICTDLDKDM